MGFPIVYCGQPGTPWPGQLPAPSWLTASQRAGQMEEAPFKAPCTPRDYAIPQGNLEGEGKCTQLRNFGVLQGWCPKDPITQNLFRNLNWYEKLEQVAQGQGSTLTGQSPANACPGINEWIDIIKWMHNKFLMNKFKNEWVSEQMIGRVDFQEGRGLGSIVIGILRKMQTLERV